jgi:hypothetical protein
MVEYEDTVRFLINFMHLLYREVSKMLELAFDRNAKCIKPKCHHASVPFSPHLFVVVVLNVLKGSQQGVKLARRYGVRSGIAQSIGPYVRDRNVRNTLTSLLHPKRQRVVDFGGQLDFKYWYKTFLENLNHFRYEGCNKLAVTALTA